MRPRRLMARGAVLEPTALSLNGAFVKSKPSSTAIARPRRSLSTFSSATIRFRSNLASYHEDVWFVAIRTTLLFCSKTATAPASLVPLKLADHRRELVSVFPFLKDFHLYQGCLESLP